MPTLRTTSGASGSSVITVSSVASTTGSSAAGPQAARTIAIMMSKLIKAQIFLFITFSSIKKLLLRLPGWFGFSRSQLVSQSVVLSDFAAPAQPPPFISTI
jgi:hypothetical protein